MPSTARFALPYPALTDSADVPRDISALATALDALDLRRPALVTSTLPGSPTDGQECYYLAHSAQGIVWHLRYRTASASTHKWEAVGGAAPIHDEIGSGDVSTLESTASLTSAGLSTYGPSVVVPLAGEYEVTALAGVNGISTSLSASAGLFVQLNGAAALNWTVADALEFVTAQSPRTLATEALMDVAAGAKIELRYATSNTSAAMGFYRRKLLVRPIRVG
jgi:hypothetical protein